MKPMARLPLHWPCSLAYFCVCHEHGPYSERAREQHPSDGVNAYTARPLCFESHYSLDTRLIAGEKREPSWFCFPRCRVTRTWPGAARPRPISTQGHRPHGCPPAVDGSMPVTEESPVCDCRDELKPVCSESGRTFVNPCLADCAKVSYTPGPCSDDPIVTITGGIDGGAITPVVGGKRRGEEGGHAGSPSALCCMRRYSLQLMASSAVQT